MTPPFGTLVVRLLAFLVTYPFLPSVPTGGPCQNSTSIWSNCQWKKRREWKEFPFFWKLTNHNNTEGSHTPHIQLSCLGWCYGHGMQYGRRREDNKIHYSFLSNLLIFICPHTIAMPFFHNRATPWNFITIAMKLHVLQQIHKSLVHPAQ
jgi:hypothetical protein